MAPGERVAAGQQLGECGNSGNSSDPHVHFQLMDGPDLTTAHGLPFEWEYLGEDGARRRGVPANEKFSVAPSVQAHSDGRWRRSCARRRGPC